MPTPYFVILDNSLVDEPLAPGLPYWLFPASRLPNAGTAARFVEDVLYQSELWANAVANEEWVDLHVLERRKMCPRCGHLLVRMCGGEGDDDSTPVHIVWYIAENPQSTLMTHEAILHLGLWHEAYLAHRCEVNFFG